MNRLVYLYELDSTISSEEGIKAGRNALLEETLARGNQVVITFNQLVDSHALVGLLQDQTTYGQMLQLFKNGSIKVVRFRRGQEEVRTAAQYLLGSLESYRENKKENTKAGKFIFGAIPIKREDTESIDKLYRAIMYSDTSLIEDKQLLSYVKVILEISKNPDCYIAGKNPDKQLKFFVVLNRILEAESFKENKKRFSKDEKKLYLQSIELLCSIRDSSQLENPNARSGWLELIKGNNDYTEDAKNLAKYIINLCYNYVVEDGIENVSKRYTSESINAIPSDYMSRIRRYFDASKQVVSDWEKGVKTAPEKWTKIKLTTAVYILNSMQWLRKKQKNNIKQQYDDDYKKELVRWQLLRALSILLSMCMAFVYGALFYATDWLSGQWKGILKSGVESAVSLLPEAAINTIITTISFAVVMAVYKMIKKAVFSKFKINIKIPDFAESFFRLLKGFRDILVIIIWRIEKLFAGKASR